MTKPITTSGSETDNTEYPPPAPPADDVKSSPPAQMELTPPDGLRLCDTGRGVSTLQVRIGVGATGLYDETTDYAVRRMQDEMGMEVTGVATAEFHNRLGLPYPPLDS